MPGQDSTPKAAAMPEAAESFLADMTSDVQEGFQPEATTSFEATALHGLKDINASSGRVVCTLPVRGRVQNRYKTLHGGCTGQHDAEYAATAIWFWMKGSNLVHLCMGFEQCHSPLSHLQCRCYKAPTSRNCLACNTASCIASVTTSVTSVLPNIACFVCGV